MKNQEILDLLVNLSIPGYFVGEAMKITEQDRVCIPVPF